MGTWTVSYAHRFFRWQLVWIGLMMIHALIQSFVSSGDLMLGAALVGLPLGAALAAPLAAFLAASAGSHGTSEPGPLLVGAIALGTACVTTVLAVSGLVLSDGGMSDGFRNLMRYPELLARAQADPDFGPSGFSAAWADAYAVGWRVHVGPALGLFAGFATVLGGMLPAWAPPSEPSRAMRARWIGAGLLGGALLVGLLLGYELSVQRRVPPLLTTWVLPILPAVAVAAAIGPVSALRRMAR